MPTERRTGRIDPLLLLHRLAAVHHLAVHHHHLPILHLHHLSVLHHHRSVRLHLGAVGHGHLFVHRPGGLPAHHHHHLPVLHHDAVHVSGNHDRGEKADGHERDSNGGDDPALGHACLPGVGIGAALTALSL